MHSKIFTEKDIEQLSKQGISLENTNWQLDVFREGVPFINLKRAAKERDGVLSLSDEELKNLIKRYDESSGISKLKFVPASGAASRMFKTLFEYLESNEKDGYIQEPSIEEFVGHINSFAFSDELKEVIEANGQNLETLIDSKQYNSIIEGLLLSSGLGYGNLPKGLLKFHSYQKGNRTAFEEHLVEGAMYAGSSGKRVDLHFTVSPEHIDAFELLLKEIQPVYEKQFNVIYNITFSVQQPSSDTLAVDLENKPFRNEDGSILFRPGGHGALINNLNELDSDIIFIKNIDNVVPENHLASTIEYKKVLAGKVIEIQEKIFSLLNELESEECNSDRLKEILQYIQTVLCYETAKPIDVQDFSQARSRIKAILNRPVRVCGVVRNQGEPGGGPFWAPNSQGDVSLQIIESSQVDTKDSVQRELFHEATHFNPVDLACGTKDYRGNSFDLSKYSDPATCFISHKSKDGKKLKALELPGLWNGAMADWNTIFIEVPLETFNPVKTVNDLLRPQHQH